MALTLAPTLTARLAAVSRRLCGVNGPTPIARTAGSKTLRRKLLLSRSPPAPLAQTSSSGRLPATCWAKASIRNRGSGTTLRLWDLGVTVSDSSQPSGTFSATSSRARSRSRRRTRRARISPQRRPASGWPLNHAIYVGAAGALFGLMSDALSETERSAVAVTTQASSGTIPYRPMTLADLAGHLAAAGDDRHRWRLVAEFLEEHRHELADERPALLVDEPPSSRYERWDVLLAAVAEHLATIDDRWSPRLVRRPAADGFLVPLQHSRRSRRRDGACTGKFSQSRHLRRSRRVERRVSPPNSKELPQKASARQPPAQAAGSDYRPGDGPAYGVFSADHTDELLGPSDRGVEQLPREQRRVGRRQ